MGKKRRAANMTANMQITAVHCEGYEFELFTCCDEPGTFFYSWFCSPCMAGDIQAAIHPENGCGNTCFMIACCPFLYVAKPMDKWQAKFHLPERNFVDKFIIDLAVVLFCLPCELTREWRQVANYQLWVAEGGLDEAENKKGVYEDQGGMSVPGGNTAAPNYGAPAPNPYANQGQPAPNPYSNTAPNPYGAPPPNQQQPPNPHGAPPPNQQQPPYEGQPPTQTGTYGQ